VVQGLCPQTENESTSLVIYRVSDSLVQVTHALPRRKSHLQKHSIWKLHPNQSPFVLATSLKLLLLPHVFGLHGWLGAPGGPHGSYVARGQREVMVWYDHLGWVGIAHHTEHLGLAIDSLRHRGRRRDGSQCCLLSGLSATHLKAIANTADCSGP